MFKSKCFYVVMVILAVVACSPKGHRSTSPISGVTETPTNVGPANDSLPASDGGINGGGGGMLPSNPIHVSRVRSIIFEGKKNLIPIVKQEQLMFAWNNDPSELDKKLYGGKPNLYDVLMTTDIDVEYEKPCLDALKREMDGSVFGRTANAICISAKRIAPKLIEERANSEILALVIHELSHKLGANEEEAVKIQIDFASRLAGIPEMSQTSAKSYIESVETAAKELAQLLWQTNEKIDSLSQSDFAKRLDEVVLKIGQFFELELKFPRSILNADENELFDIYRIQLRYANFYILGLDGPNSAYYKELGTKDFGDNKSLTYGELAEMDKVASLKVRRFKNVRIHRVETVEQAKQILKDVTPFFTALESTATSIRLSWRPNPLPMPDQVSPFSNFVGEYEVTSMTCSPKESSRVKTLKFTFAHSEAHRGVIATAYYDNGSSQLGGFYDGGGDFWGAAAVTVDGNESWAERSAEFGSRWGTQDLHSLSLKKMRIEKTDAFDVFTLTESFLSRKEDYDKKINVDTASSCTYKLKKIK